MVDSIPYFIARISEDKDFMKLREIAENHDGWSLDYNKTTVKVWTKHVADSSFNMVKVWSIFSDINCVDLYDTIQDPAYRKVWDSQMIVGIDIGYLNPNNDISYYAMHCPAPLKNRDLVLQKSWLDNGAEFYIMNHSVYHKDYPPKKDFVRAISFFTGYFIKSNDLNRESDGCELSYVTRCDPQGILPPWLVNKCTQILAPKYVKQIHSAASRYESWKKNNNPHIKPWVYPEQIQTPRVSVRDCVPGELELQYNPFLQEINFESYLPPPRREEVSNTKEDVSKVQSKSSPTSSYGESSPEQSDNSDLKDRKKSQRKTITTFLRNTIICRKK